jgi:hypothetical protein
MATLGDSNLNISQPEIILQDHHSNNVVIPTVQTIRSLDNTGSIGPLMNDWVVQ